MTFPDSGALNYSGLERGTRLADIRLLFWREARPARAVMSAIGAIAGGLLVAALVVAVLIVDSRWIPAFEGRPELRLLIALVIVCWMAAALVWAFHSIARSARLSRWAFDNDLGYARSIEDRRWAGTPFRSGRSVTYDVLASDRPGLDFVIGRYRWIGDKQQGVSLRSFTFLQLTLPSQVPHVVLRNRRAGVFAGQGLSLRGSQRLSLEGDFDRTFQLHVPAGYERDALYIFTPDLMARFLDLAPDAEVELVGDKVIFYLGRSPRLWKAPRLRALMEAAGALQHKLDRQTTRYSDDRAGARAGGVALAGLRLHGGVPWATVLMGLLAGLPTVAAAIVLFTTFN